MKIEIKNVSKKFKNNLVLDKVNLTFTTGHIYGLKGRNGSGKSVFLKILAGLYTPSEGEVLFDNKKFNPKKEYPPNMRALIENPTFFANMTGYENLKLLAKIQGKISDKEITQTIISPDFSEGSSSKSSNIWFRNYGTRSSNQQSGVPEWSDWSLLLMSDYGNKYRYMKPYLLSYYKFNSLNSDSTQTDIENAFGSLEDEQEFIAAMND